MSTAILSNHMESTDFFRQNHQNLFMNRRQLTQADCDVLGLFVPANNNRTPVVGSRSRNSSGGSNSDSSSTSSIPKFTTAPANTNRMTSFPEGLCSQPKDILSISGVPHRKLDRSISEPVERVLSGTSPQSQKSVNSTRYKTELCRPFEESGFCKYGDKCQFAHGDPELRSLNRHPKYKTELCRTFHTVGFCPYGPRCHFIHNEDERRLSQINTLKHHQVQEHQAHQQQLQAVQQLLAQAQQQVQQAQQAVRSQPATPTKTHMGRPRALNLTSLPVMMRNGLGSTADSPPLSVTGSPTSSPTAMLSDHHESMMTSLHPAMYRSTTPPPQSAPPGFAAPAFSFHDTLGSVSPISASDMSLTPSPPLASPLNVHTDDAIGNLAAGLQAASLQLTTDHYRMTETLKSRPYMPPSPPSSHDDAALAGLRLPIFSKFAHQDE